MLSFAQLTIVVDEIPSNTPEGSDIHIAGDFQGWDPGSSDYMLNDNGDGTYSIELDIAAGTITFKFTRGGWDTVEGNENGGFLPDRTYSYNGLEETLNLQILSWEDVGGTNSSAAENVEIMDTDFYISQLDRYRRIWVYTPPNYDDTDEHYKVLYMHDGQNLFDAASSFSGEWEVDETLNALFDQGDEGCIVVGIDNGGIHRIDEYSPWVNVQYGGGEGRLYMDFIVNTLKPYIDENYRTRPEREWTGIMGSSMGGLISAYGGVEHSDVFSRIGAFSPSYWFSDETYDHMQVNVVTAEMRIYTIAGEQEGPVMTNGVANMNNIMSNTGWYDENEFITLTHEYGTHSESYWRNEFEDAYLWLWDNDTSVNDFASAEWVVYPNPSETVIQLEIENSSQVTKIELIDSTGKLIYTTSQFERMIDVSQWEGVHVIAIYLEGGEKLTKRIVLR
ncbi:MAG: alpha/beta hydrolase-fold protein [Flavobacteriales bacterium]|nr:alpha/beta hydrolase-fold protein [Flavobacteriales bacterium]